MILKEASGAENLELLEQVQEILVLQKDIATQAPALIKQTIQQTRSSMPIAVKPVHGTKLSTEISVSEPNKLPSQPPSSKQSHISIRFSPVTDATSSNKRSFPADLQVNDVEPGLKKVRTRTGLGTVLHEDWKASVRLVPTFSPNELTMIAATFRSTLADLTVIEHRKNEEYKTSFSSEQIDKILYFFFYELLGVGGQKRLFRLFDELQHVQDEGDAIQRPDSGTQGTEIPPELQAVLDNYVRWSREQEAPSIMRDIRDAASGLQLYVSYQTLLDRASSPEGWKLRAFMDQCGLRRSSRDDARKCIHQYLTDQLKIKRGKLVFDIQSCKGIYYLVEEFGRGILLFLPTETPFRTDYMSGQKAELSSRNLGKLLPIIKELCSSAEPLLECILNGQISVPLLGFHRPSREQLSIQELFAPMQQLEVIVLEDTDDEEVD